MNIDEQIERELTCIDDLTDVIKLHVKAGRINIAKQLERDLHNSLDQLEKLHKKKELWATVADLNQRGILVQVVKKLAHQA
ncbi:hypothetical protein Q8G28_03975 [Lysinibacillus capsici]|uniref:hypothetical protein n=1 Tax=Lysinibacillus capsici TaxID=2115968 RepID=UPI0027308C95|nr:hypothetical protein [Lysinibacillus capsici]MDP1391984.1 hypothetical protein [Lysinibacillus capsici]MDP1412460.1 hypothetical protein [Lysinibacillus capsici]MDP1428908.1 hypothetical protein [Lysinibacillus capsici]